MPRERCSVCGGWLRTDGGCTKCENRRFRPSAVSALRRFWPVLLAAIVLFGSCGYAVYQGYRLYQSVCRLEQDIGGKLDTLEEQTVKRLDEVEEQIVGRIEKVERELKPAVSGLEEIKEDVKELKERVVVVESIVSENKAHLEEIEEILELKRRRQARPPVLPVVPVHQVDVEEGDTVWVFLIEFLDRYPTREEINRVVAANGLEAFDHPTLKDSCGDPLYIVLIYPGDKVDLGPALGDAFSYVYV